MNLELQAAAQKYWSVSRVWRGQSSERLTTHDALTTLKEISLAFGPHRQLRRRTVILLNEIVQGKPQSKTKQQRA